MKIDFTQNKRGIIADTIIKYGFENLKDKPEMISNLIKKDEQGLLTWLQNIQNHYIENIKDDNKIKELKNILDYINDIDE